MKFLTLREALREAMSEEMRRDELVFLMGEEVAEYDGAYKVSKGMLTEFGPKRVIDTPIAELGFAAIGVGAAMNGVRPIIEFMTWNFAVLAFDQIVNGAAKMLNMSAGQITCPIVFRGPTGSAGQLGQQHSQTFESWLGNVPGLKIISCVTPNDAKGLMKSAIRDNDPVCFMESEVMYGWDKKFYEKAGLTDFYEPLCATPDHDEHLIPIGKADIKKTGSDVTLVTYNKMLIPTLQAAIELAKEGIHAEVIDLRTIRPLDYQTIVQSVQKTNRIVVIDESWPFAGISSEIAYHIQRNAFDYLDAPLIRINGADASMPYNPHMIEAYLPNPAKIIRAVKEVMYLHK